MQKISDSTSTANAAGEFTEGDPAAGAAATLLKAAWLNSIQRELINVVSGGGLVPKPSDDSQLLKAIKAIQASAIQTAVANLVASSPAALDTLKELAAALGDDPNFATTMANALAGKASKSTTLAGYNIIDALYIGGTSRQRPNLSAPNPGGYATGGGALVIREAQENGKASKELEYAPRLLFLWDGVKVVDLAMDALGNLLWGGKGVWTEGNFDPGNKADKATTLPGYGIVRATVAEVTAGINNEKPITPASLQGLDPWASQPVGALVCVRDDLVGASVPSLAGPYRYIKLTASDAFNSGALTSESVSGSYPLVIATAVISFGGSPFIGQTIQLINTERRFLRAGLSGIIEQDTLQGHGHNEKVGAPGAAGVTADTLISYAGGLSAAGAYNQRQTAAGPTKNSVAIVEAISDPSMGSVRTSSETRPKTLGVTYYMRIK